MNFGTKVRFLVRTDKFCSKASFIPKHYHNCRFICVILSAFDNGFGIRLNIPLMKFSKTDRLLSAAEIPPNSKKQDYTSTMLSDHLSRKPKKAPLTPLTPRRGKVLIERVMPAVTEPVEIRTYFTKIGK